MANDSENVENYTLVYPKEIYFFLKHFDADTQSLRGVHGHFVRRDAKISEEAKHVLKVGLREEWIRRHMWRRQYNHRPVPSP